MASPPYSSGGGGGATSPPGASPLALPRQRPALALPAGIKSQPHSRKASFTSASSSAHPLRQTSFPPPDSLEAQHALAEDNALRQYSPSADGSLDDFSDDNDIRSAISGPGGGGGAGGGDDGISKKRKRREKRPRGRPAKMGSVRAGSLSAINGEDGEKRGGSRSVISAGQEGDAEPDDEEEEEEEAGETDAKGGRLPLYEGGQMTAVEMAEEKDRKNLFYAHVGRNHKERYASFGKAKLKTGDVRRLVNQVLGQSVPQNVVLAVSAYTKMFAGQLIESAREVQGEWTAVEEHRADGSENPVWKKLKRSREGRMKGESGEDDHDPKAADPEMGSETNGIVKEPSSPSQPSSIPSSLPNGHQTNGNKHANQTNGDKHADQTNGDKHADQTNGDIHTDQDKRDADDDTLRPGGSGGLGKDIEESDRGPLLPDHFREALRRYKRRRSGGAVGFTGLSLEGAQNTAARVGGRRLFK